MRFWARVLKGAPDQCWPWIAYRDGEGYGRFVHRGDCLGAHKVSLELKLGRSLRPDEVTRHLCHNPPCCNPAHLAVGTRADNNHDTIAAGRNAFGERNGSHRLTEAQVVAIRIRYSLGETALSIAPDYGISDRMVGKVAHGDTWTHVGGPITPTRRPNRKHFDRERGELVPASERGPRKHFGRTNPVPRPSESEAA